MKQFNRKEILDNLNKTIQGGSPIIMGGAGIGLVAKVADAAGIDILMAYNTGPFRMDGHGSLSGYLAYGDSNAITFQLGHQILNVVENTPVIAGIGAADPYRDVDQMIEKMIEIGFSGITNVPTAGLYDGIFREHIDSTKLGYPEEVKLIKNCRDRDIFTVAYAFSVEECQKMAAAGADLIGAHVGLTTGGMIGAQKTISIEKACEKTQNMYEAAVNENSDVLVVSHGGPFDTPEKVNTVFEKTSIDGYLGASSIERIPVEKAIGDVINQYKSLKLKRHRQ